MSKRSYEEAADSTNCKKPFMGNKSSDPDFFEKIKSIANHTEFLNSEKLTELFVNQTLDSLNWLKLFLELSIEFSTIEDFFVIIKSLKKLGFSQNNIHDSIIELLVGIYKNHTDQEINDIFSNKFFCTLLFMKVTEKPYIYMDFISKCNGLENNLRFENLKNIIICAILKFK